MKVYCFFFFVLMTVLATQAHLLVRNVPDVTRKIHGSYGAFRDFTSEDCDQAHENQWTRCANNESPAFAYHWNNKLKGCERVIYKGCGASRNNFVSERDCNNQAKPVCGKK